MENKRKNWEEFEKSGLLWWVNRQLHLFGWNIELEFDGEQIIGAHPRKTNFEIRGYERCAENKGFARLSKYLSKNSKTMAKIFVESLERYPY